MEIRANGAGLVDLDLRQLRHFLALAEGGSFTDAAARLGISQPGLSSSLHRLEDAVGVVLLERNTRQLTPAGEQLRTAARRILAEVLDARHRMADVAEVLSGQVALGTVQTFVAYDVPALLARFHASYPGIAASLVEASTAELLGGVQSGTLDLAFVALDASELPRDLEILETMSEEILLITADSHALAGEEALELAELGGYDFVDFQAGTGLQTVVEQLCETVGLHRRIQFQATEMELVVSLVAHGLGIALVPRGIAERSGLHVIEIAPHSPRRELALVARSSGVHNPAARALLNVLSSGS